MENVDKCKKGERTRGKAGIATVARVNGRISCFVSL
jgi:hypothetical protein